MRYKDTWQTDGYEKLSHVEPVGYENFYSSLKTTIAKDKYEPF